MPKKNKTSVPAYREHKPSGRARVILNGRHIYLPGPYNSAESRREYDRILSEFLVGGRVSANIGDSASIAELVNGYRLHCKDHYLNSDGTLADEADNIRCALKPLVKFYGDTPADQFTPIRLEALRKKMITMGWSRTYINSAVGRLRRCFKWAASRGLIPITAWQTLQTIDGLRYGRSGARETDPVKPVSQLDIDGTLPFLNRHIRAMVQVQLLSGSRGGEICRMKIGQIDMSRQVWEYRPAKHKTSIHGHQRIIYLGPKAQEILRPFLKADPTAYVFSPKVADEERRAELSAKRVTPLSCGNKPGSNVRKHPRRKPGDCYDSDAYAQAVRYGVRAANKEAAKALGITVEKLPESHRIKNWHPHQLRHTAATRLREVAGVDVARTALGHSSLDATEIYAEPARAAAIEAMKKIG